MAVDYATLKKGGFMRQKQKNHFSLRLRVVGGNLTATQLAKLRLKQDTGILIQHLSMIQKKRLEERFMSRGFQEKNSS